jgi:hypothetical protein
MEKKITITVTGERQQLQIEGMNNFEAIGLLRFYEKYIWLKLCEQEKPKKVAKTTKFKDNKKEVAHKRITALCEHFDIPEEAKEVIKSIASDSYIIGSNDAHVILSERI